MRLSAAVQCLAVVLLLNVCQAHVRLLFPAGRTPYDFLDNVRTGGAGPYCGSKMCIQGVKQAVPTYNYLGRDPQADATSEPEGTTEPAGETTTEPEGEATTEPEGETATEPEGEATTEPEGETATEPEGEGETVPEGEATTQPEGETEADTPATIQGKDTCWESPVTTLKPGQTIDVEWHMGRPHRPRSAISEQYDIFFIERGNVTLLKASTADTTATSLTVTLPTDAVCADAGSCQLALKAKSAEYGGTYYFKACADIVLEPPSTTDCPADCDGHGQCQSGVCTCEDKYTGKYCSEKVQCTKDSHCTEFDGGECYMSSHMCFYDAASTSTTLTPAIDESYYNDPAHLLSQGSFTGDGYKGYWKRLDMDRIEIAMTAETDSWVGIGWRPASMTGHAMNSVDMVIGFVLDDGTVRVDDYWSVSRSTPLPDSVYGASSSILEYTGQQDNGWTTIKFIRSIAGDGDDCDYPLTAESMSVVYAFGQVKDASGSYRVPDVPTPHVNDAFYESDVLLYHGGDKALTNIQTGRGSTSVNFLSVEGCSDMGYDNQQKFNSEYCVHWSNDLDNAMVSVALEATTTGWVGLAVSPNGGMIGSTAVIGSIAQDGTGASVKVYSLNGKSEAGVVEDSSITLENTSVTEENDATVVKFDISLERWGIVYGGQTTMVWAYSQDGDDALTYHKGTKGPVTVDFALDGVTDAATDVATDIVTVAATDAATNAATTAAATQAPTPVVTTKVVSAAHGLDAMVAMLLAAVSLLAAMC